MLFSKGFCLMKYYYHNNVIMLPDNFIISLKELFLKCFNFYHNINKKHPYKQNILFSIILKYNIDLSPRNQRTADLAFTVQQNYNMCTREINTLTQTMVPGVATAASVKALCLCLIRCQPLLIQAVLFTTDRRGRTTTRCGKDGDVLLFLLPSACTQ